MADIDPNLAPSVMPAEQPIAKADGRPTTPMLNWLSAMRDWTKKSVVDLTTKITTLIDDQGDLSARLDVEEIARVDGDTAISTHLTSVEAKANDATANGQVYLQAMAGPAGSAAAYGIFLKAGNKFTGLMLVADSLGGSEIVLMSGALRFYDSASGSLINMLSYSGGEWLLNGNVTLQSSTADGTLRWANGNLILYDNLGNDIVGFGLNLPP